MKRLLIACGLAAVGVAAVAQPPDMAALAQKVGQGARANAAALRQYAWTMRVAITLKGEPKPAKLFAMRFGADGTLEKTPIADSASSDAAPAAGGGGRGGRLKERIKEKKVAEAKEWAGDLVEVIKTYLVPSPDVMQMFFAKASTATAPDGKVQISAEDVMRPGDRLAYELNGESLALIRSTFETMLEKDPVTGTAEFETLPEGPRYAARTTVSVPAKQLMATIENVNYVKQ